MADSGNSVDNIGQFSPVHTKVKQSDFTTAAGDIEDAFLTAHSLEVVTKTYKASATNPKTQRNSVRHSDLESKHWMIGHPAFQCTINVAIVVSAIQMGVAAHKLPELDTGLDVMEHLFTGLFASEMLIKLHALKRNYFLDPATGYWNVLDFVIAWVAVVDMWVLPRFVAGSSGGGLGMVRVFKLLRLLRMLKLLHHVPELMMVIEGMLASLKSMIWIILLLAGVMYILGIICVEVIGNATAVYPGSSDVQDDMTEEVVTSFNSYMYFGTLWRSLITLFSMMLLAEWSDVIRPIAEMQPYMIVMFAGLVFLTTFGIFNVIIGVVVERTTAAMESAREDDLKTKRKKHMDLVIDIARMMSSQDKNSDGMLSAQEMAGDASPMLTEALDSINLPHGFTLLDLHQMFDGDGSSQVSADEFIIGMLRLIESTPFQQACLTQLLMCQTKALIVDLRKALSKEVSSELAALRRQIFVALEAPFRPSESRVAFPRQGFSLVAEPLGVSDNSASLALAALSRNVAALSLDLAAPARKLAEALDRFGDARPAPDTVDLRGVPARLACAEPGSMTLDDCCSVSPSRVEEDAPTFSVGSLGEPVKPDLLKLGEAETLRPVQIAS